VIISYHEIFSALLNELRVPEIFSALLNELRVPEIFSALLNELRVPEIFSALLNELRVPEASLSTRRSKTVFVASSSPLFCSSKKTSNLHRGAYPA
jgi:hypothetical protein